MSECGNKKGAGTMIGRESVAARPDRSWFILLMTIVTSALLAACGEAPTDAVPAQRVVRTSSPLASVADPLPTAMFVATPIPATASRAPRQFFLNLDVNLADTPQIPPRMPVTDPNAPTFSQADVEQYVLTHHMAGKEKISIVEGSSGMLDGVTLTTVATYNAHHADMLPLAGDYLIYLTELRGVYSVAGGAYSPDPRPTYNTAIWVFHAQRGVILAKGIVDR